MHKSGHIIFDDKYVMLSSLEERVKAGTLSMSAARVLVQFKINGVNHGPVLRLVLKRCQYYYICLIQFQAYPIHDLR